jgi:hypothetical protein
MDNDNIQNVVVLLNYLLKKIWYKIETSDKYRITVYIILNYIIKIYVLRDILTSCPYNLD